MIWDVLCLFLIVIALCALVTSWKRNVVSKKNKNIKIEEFFFDDDDYEDEHQNTKPSVFKSNFKNLDARVSGAVRYNQSMYYSQEEFEKIKENVLNKQFPM